MDLYVKYPLKNESTNTVGSNAFGVIGINRFADKARALPNKNAKLFSAKLLLVMSVILLFFAK